MTAPKAANNDSSTDTQEKGDGGRRSWLRPRGPVGTLVASLVGIMLIYAGALYVLRPASPGKKTSLDVVLQAAIERRVVEAKLLDEDSRVTGTFRPDAGGKPKHFYSAYPHSDAATNDLVRALFAGGAHISIDPQPTKKLVRFVAQFLMPLVILANLFALLFYLTRGGSGASQLRGFGRIGDKKVKSGSGTTFADVAAAGEAIVELADVRNYLADPRAFKAMSVVPPKGVLLMGPPGCGKTLLARAVAGEAKASFFNVSGSEFVEALVGVGAARVRDLFAQARASAPSILFIDELDAVGRQRGAGLGGGHDEREQTLNELLVQMDGFSPTDGVVVMAATNRPDILDPALLRPGRFDRQVTVDRPDLEGRLEILHLHARGKPFTNPDHDLPALANATPGFSGADLANALNEAGLLAVRERSAAISGSHLDEAMERVKSGPRRKVAVLSADDKRRIAYHESAHALVAAAMGKAGALDRISVISRGRGLAHLSMLTEDTVLPTRSDMLANVAIAMAGLAAEELVMGEPSVGSEADLQRATTIARDMAGRFGMSAGIGRVRVLHDHQEVFLGRDYLSTREVSQPTLEQLDADVRQILDAQEEVARALLVSNRKVLDSIAEALEHHETLRGDELRGFLSGVTPFRRPPTPAVNGSAATRSRTSRSGRGATA